MWKMPDKWLEMVARRTEETCMTSGNPLSNCTKVSKAPDEQLTELCILCILYMYRLEAV